MKKLVLLLLIVQSFFAFAQENGIIRSRESFNDNWKFKRFGLHPVKPGKYIEEPEGLESTAYNDNKWRNLNLPHDWGIEGPFRDDLDNSTGLLPWKGIGWYRKHFVVSQSDKGKLIFIDFDGAMANARVWLNGHYIGEWPYGYSSFRLNLTPFINYGGENVISVRLNTEDFDSRWYPGAGIYRNVWLVKTAVVHIDHWGIYLTTPEITEEEALVNLRVNVINQDENVPGVSVQTIIYNSRNEIVAKSKIVSADIPSFEAHKFLLKIKVKNPQLWDINNPMLYEAVTDIYVDEKLLDRQSTDFGFRTIEFTADKGFLLNGRRVDIKGVCNHHDLGPLGAAFNTRAAERQLEILKEMGCNSIRTSHNPPAPELLDLCDKMGFLVMDEAFDCWERGKGKKDYHIHFDAWYLEDLTAMIRRDYNHPSVFMWSIGNEVPDQGNPQLAKRLANIVHMEDPTRPVTAGCNRGNAGFNGFEKALDVFGYNYNHRSYEKFFNDPEKKIFPFIASETSSCVSSRGEYFFPVKKGSASRNLPGKGIFQMTSYDQLYPGWGVTPDSQFVMNVTHPRVMGEYVWTGFDYIGEPTPYNRDITNLLNYTDSSRKARLRKYLDELGTEEVPSRSSYFGINDLCGFKKDRFYIYQAHWNSDVPMAHILPHWNWPERIGKNVPVHVYTSGDEAELFLNDKSLGRKKKGPYEFRLRWDSVIYSPGELRVKVWRNGKKWAEDIMKTTKEVAKIKLEVDRKEINADGKDLAFITVNLVDNKNLLVPGSHNLVKFEIEGPGEIVAVGNGDPTCHEPFIADKHSVFNGKCLVIVRSTKTPGVIKLMAKSKGLEGSSIEIKGNRGKKQL
jgi:beta-galactosidase